MLHDCTLEGVLGAMPALTGGHRAASRQSMQRKPCRRAQAADGIAARGFETQEELRWLAANGWQIDRAATPRLFDATAPRITPGSFECGFAGRPAAGYVGHVDPFAGAAQRTPAGIFLAGAGQLVG
jgi:hypothetical protein